MGCSHCVSFFVSRVFNKLNALLVPLAMVMVIEGRKFKFKKLYRFNVGYFVDGAVFFLSS